MLKTAINLTYLFTISLKAVTCLLITYVKPYGYIDQAVHSVSPDLGPNCLCRLTADNKSGKELQANKHHKIKFQLVNSND